MLRELMKRMRVNVADVVELDELQGIVGLVATGVGIAIVPRAANLHFPASVRALTLGEETFFREVGIVEPKTSNRQGASHDFTECLRTLMVCTTRITVRAPLSLRCHPLWTAQLRPKPYKPLRRQH